MRVSALSLVPVAMAFSNGLDHLRSPEHLSSATNMESSVETTKPTDKPHSKLDVLSGKTRAGTQSPTKVFIRGKRKLKGPLARLNQRQRRTRSEWQTWQGIEVVCRRQIHNSSERTINLCSAKWMRHWFIGQTRGKKKVDEALVGRLSGHSAFQPPLSTSALYANEGIWVSLIILS